MQTLREDTDLYEDDEPIETIEAILARGPNVITWPHMTVLDVAAIFLDRLGPMDTMKLEKLCYFAQAEHLGRLWQRLYGEPVQAWTDGPVIPKLFRAHRKSRTISKITGGDAGALAKRPHPDEINTTIEAVIERYGHLSGRELSDLAHAEQPWIDARRGLRDDERGDQEIPVVAMRNAHRPEE